MSHSEKADHLPLFASPLIHHQKSHADDLIHEEFVSSETAGIDDFRGSGKSAQTHNVADGEGPVYKRHKEATTVELFYDLFFVANLTVFSSVKEVNDGKTLSQYVGFFCIIWFVWYQVSMYDVRFAVDSLFERIARVVQFGVMIGFAISGPTFNPGETLEDITDASSEPNQIPDPNLATFKTITLILMVNRLTLVVQYLQTMWQLRQHKETRTPILLIAATYLVAGIIYGALFAAFNHYHTRPFIVWYVGSILETIICTGVSSHWRVISFKGSHLVQRMSLLTLIILGEGVMGLAEKCQNIVKGRIFYFDASTIGDVICGILIVYFLYVIYFDWLQEEHMGTIRQQIWSFLHFPLHLALVLSLEGASQFLAWRAATVSATNLFSYFGDVLPAMSGNTQADFQSTSAALQNISVGLLEQAYLSAKGLGGLQSVVTANATVFEALSSLNETQTGNLEGAINSVVVIYGTLATLYYTAIGFEPPAAKAAEESSSTEISSRATEDPEVIEASQEFLKVLQVIRKTLIYFFVCLGAFVVLHGILAWISKRHRTLTDRIRLGCAFVIGVAICFISLLDVDLYNIDNAKKVAVYTNFIQSPWVMPTATLLLFIIVILNSIRVPFLRRS
ncbi:hypothetical protein K461DRAFT_279070 [Myriangium duriaei CBS 260.36]|uniref:Low temperature requirement protein LtrA n=1 Tax=Myriangium duriaei CBS 260.36 TaxID=1168546 RepID=A0A9P4IX79_9PEZI|nr:hypothetical protein K461DRAFT_279070 [Myriangium duriaei CBS 260.36]